MICQKCSAENPASDKFCGGCGSPLEAAPAPVPVPGEAGAFYCARHKKEITRVRCGRCETPICTRCAVHGPAGVRCRACAKNKVALRPMGVLHEVTRNVGPSAQGIGRTVWYLAIWHFVISIFSGFFGGGHHDS